MIENDAILGRLEKLERENRRLKRWGAAAAGVLGALGLTSMVAPSLCKTVWAERFVLQDASSNTRLTLDAYSSATPVITAQGADGKVVAKLTLAAEKPTLELFDKNGASRGKFGLSDAKHEPAGEKTSCDKEEDPIAMK